ncbi:MAG: hypothetical protein MUC54_01830 [Chloroflexi bacterium]|jgi:hypothetical protein|nr:hypothetical protein [Chloroflexota bacterium]
MTDPRTPPGDLGREAVERIYREMQIDERWSVREERAFTWWGAWIRQRVWAGDAVQAGSTTLWHVRARTPALRDQPDEPVTYALVNTANVWSALSAYAYDPADGTVSVRCGAFIHEAVASWLGRYLGVATALQASTAWLQVPQFAEGRPLDEAPDHPGSGPRGEPDEMLNVAWSWPRGPVPFSPPVLRQVAAALSTDGRSLAFDEEPPGLRAFFPFAGEEPASWSLATVEHPILGNGALASLVIPQRMGRLRALMIANGLNLAESADWAGEDRPHALGTWTADKVLVHSAFFPSVLFSRLESDEIRRTIENLLTWGAVRARFAGERLPALEAAARERYPDDEPVPEDEEPAG